MSLFEALYRIYDALTDPPRAAAMLTAMAQIISAWLLYAAVFTGIGIGLRRAYGLRALRAWDWLIAFWVGWSISLGLLQLWHLWQPINANALIALAVLAALGFALNLRDLLALFRRPHGWRYLLTLGAALPLLANSALGAPSVADFALYHQQAIQWANAYPALPGLGNLHGRLAFNNASFLYAALTDAAPFPGAGNHIAPSLLIVALLALGVYGWRRTQRGDTTPRTFLLTLLIPVALWAASSTRHYIRTPDNDLPAIILTLIVGVLLLKLWEPPESPRDQAHTFFALITIAAAGVISKLSFAPVAALAGAVALTALIVRQRAGLQSRYGLVLIIGSVLLGAGFVSLWMVRGVILSGYPAYPSTFAAFDVDWRVPCAAAQSEADWVYSWARTPGAYPDDVLGSWRWLIPWLVRTLSVDDVFTPLLITAVTIGFAWMRRALPRASWSLLLVPLFGLGFWFFTAPDPRFALGSFWLLAYGSLALLLADYARTHAHTSQIAVLLIAVLISYHHLAEFLTYGSGFQSAPLPKLATVELTGGLTVSVPIERLADPPGDERCYRADLPCTPYPNPKLTLRQPASLASGFRVVDTPLSCIE